MWPFNSPVRSKQIIGPMQMGPHDDEEVAFLDHHDHEKIRPVVSHPNRSALPWMISTFLLALISATSLYINFTTVSSPCRLGDALLSDMPDARHAIQYEQRTYTGELTYDDKIKKIIRPQDGEVEFFGEPGPELDAKWDIYLKDEFPIMTTEEAEPYLPQLRRIWDGEFRFEPDFSHNLHCLNAIRKTISTIHYPNTTTPNQNQNIDLLGPDWDRVHIEHCMDRIRQTILCHADLTPSPIYSWEGVAVAVGKTGMRTCRKWTPIKEWLDGRKAVKLSNEQT